jgi:hypothetical protein
MLFPGPVTQLQLEAAAGRPGAEVPSSDDGLTSQVAGIGSARGPPGAPHSESGCQCSGSALSDWRTGPRR